MRRRQPVHFAKILVYLELLLAAHALQIGESLEWHLARTSDELQKLGTFLLVERPHRAPEPLYLRRGGRVAAVLSI